MKCNFYVARLLAIALCVILSCTKKEDSPEDPQGTGTISVQIGINVVEHSTKNVLKAIQTGDFKVIIYDQADQEVISFEHASEMPSEISLTPGIYYVVAHSNNLAEAAFEEPFYFGKCEEFILDYEESKTVIVNCELMNVKVTVTYSINVMNDFTDYSTTVSHANGSLLFAGNETRAGYFTASPLFIEVNLNYTRHDGSTGMKMLTGVIENPLPRKHYEIQIDATLNEGEALISVNVDETTEPEIVDVHDTDTTTLLDRYIDPGDLIITEIMYNPDSLPDNVGEYLEIYNMTSNELDLEGLVINRGTTNTHMINGSLLIPANDQIVLARTENATEAPDYVYGTAITLPNSGTAELILIYEGVDIFSLDYENFPSTAAGRSIQLDPGHFDAADAVNGVNWCASTTSFSSGDMGTPGMLNNSCD